MLLTGPGGKKRVWAGDVGTGGGGKGAVGISGRRRPSENLLRRVSLEGEGAGRPRELVDMLSWANALAKRVIIREKGMLWTYRTH